MRYNPAIESHFPRLWAKLIDLFIFLIPLLILTGDLFYSLPIAIILVTVYGAILETKLGATVGKSILGLKVIDNDGNYPGWWRSFRRNALAPLNLTRSPWVKFRYPDFDGESQRYNMNLNNLVCKTYVVYKAKIKEIRAMQAEVDEGATS